MMEVFLKGNDQVLENIILKMKVLLLKEIGLKMKGRGTENRNFKMVLFSKELGKRDS